MHLSACSAAPPQLTSQLSCRRRLGPPISQRYLTHALMPAVPALQIVMEREQGNPEFAFLFDTRCPEHAYYRWRLFSLASGDTLRR